MHCGIPVMLYFKGIMPVYRLHNKVPLVLPILSWMEEIIEGVKDPLPHYLEEAIAWYNMYIVNHVTLLVLETL